MTLKINRITLCKIIAKPHFLQHVVFASSSYKGLQEAWHREAMQYLHQNDCSVLSFY